MEIVVALISTVFAFCVWGQEYNITFHDNAITWIEAVQYCHDGGGVLYSDEVKIRSRTNHTVWTGNYTAFTPWAIIWGCYSIDFRSNLANLFSIPHSDEAECQKNCNGTIFFAVKKSLCKCLKLSELRHKENIKPCNCNECVTVKRHQIANVNESVHTPCKHTNENCLCMAASCITNTLILTSEDCNNEYGIICNDYTTDLYGSQEYALQYCYSLGSDLQWYKNRDDICPVRQPGQKWTSGRRTVHKYAVHYNDKVSNLNPLRCFSVKNESDQGPGYVECTNLLSFFCKNGVIIGIMVSITVVVLITILILVFIFRRIHSKKQLPDNTGGNAICTANDNTAMSNYEQLDNTAEDNNKKAYDRLHVTHIPDHFNVQIQTITSREEVDLSNTKKIHVFDYTATSEYEQLDTSDKDKRTDVYEQLHAANAVVTDQVNYHSQSFIAREVKQNAESIENTNDIDNNTSSSEYDQLENAGNDDSTNVYDQLDITHKEEKATTNYHMYTNI